MMHFLDAWWNENAMLYYLGFLLVSHVSQDAKEHYKINFESKLDKL